MDKNESNWTADGTVPERAANIDKDHSDPDSPNLKATSSSQSSCASHLELYQLVRRLELARAALTMGDEHFEGNPELALNAINQAIQDVTWAISSNCGYSVVYLKASRDELHESRLFNFFPNY